MSDLLPKWERIENLKWIKWSAIFSGVAVLWTFFSGWMAYNASVSSVEISWKMTKQNEIESRIYIQKYEIYKNFSNEIFQILNFPWRSKQESTLIRYQYNIQRIEDFILVEWPKMRILAWEDVLKYFNCLSNSVDDFKLGLYQEKPDYNTLWYNFQIHVIGWIWKLENSMRIDLWLWGLPNLYFSSWWSMEEALSDYENTCNKNFNHVQTSNYFSGYIFNLK